VGDDSRVAYLVADSVTSEAEGVLPPGLEGGVPIKGQSGQPRRRSSNPATDQHEMFDLRPRSPSAVAAWDASPRRCRITAGMAVISRCMTLLSSPTGLDCSRAGVLPCS
jgi:hypothetical protein